MFTVILANIAVVSLAVIIHYECLLRLTLLLARVKIRHRLRILLGVGGALLGHAMEVWVFAFAYYFMHQAKAWGHLKGSFDGSLMDCVYFSFTTFTTLGFGDIQPTGDLRFLTGIESLTGLVLITWTASFLFVEMQKFWNAK
ncbi:potassium channel family protein [Polaromonas sp.]|uniref:potassium channel family protein n=1 Tax=Polaromonas sp. TaxID=1869339 RepID=UPI002488E17B|nr:potassium channel family protein [Polaromonas sp.]MDI1338928.1 potassium channel family protein [Polaromonas sp.]